VWLAPGTFERGCCACLCISFQHHLRLLLLALLPACSVEEARKAREAGADCILVKWELVQQYSPARLGMLVEQLRDATCGDD
jgi:hypothetical protein